jgi:hypothetical protein
VSVNPAYLRHRYIYKKGADNPDTDTNNLHPGTNNHYPFPIQPSRYFIRPVPGSGQDHLLFDISPHQWYFYILEAHDAGQLSEKR